MASFVALAITAAATIGMGNVITIFYAPHLGASSFQVGLIYGAQSFGMMLMTMPAGFIIARCGAKRVYFFSSTMVMATYLALPWLKFWYVLVGARAHRTVRAGSHSFHEQLVPAEHENAQPQ